MIAYDFYWEDEEGNDHYYATLPEKRKDPKRITEESIMKWGRLAIFDTGEIKRIYFVRKVMPEPAQSAIGDPAQ